MERRLSMIPILMLLALVVVFGLSFSWIYRFTGNVTPVFGFTYICLAGWLWGLRGGIIASLLNIPFVAFLHNMAGISLPSNFVGPLAAIALGVLVGRLSDVRRELRQQLEYGRDIEEELRQYQDTLLQKVEERTIEYAQVNEELRQEITERIAIEEELNQSRERFAKLFKRSPQWMTLSGLDDGVYLDVNDAFSDITGYSPEQAIGRTPIDLGIYPHPIQWQKALQTIQENGSINNYEMAFQHKSGEIRHALCSAEIILLKQQPSIVFVARDISERKRTEDALLHRTAHLSSIIRSSPTGIGVEVDRVITEVNRKLCIMTGYSEEELIGQPARILYPTQDEYKRAGKEQNRQISEYGTGSVETYWQRKDGANRSILLSSTPIIPENLSGGVTFTALDITDRKQAEESLRESEERYRIALDLSPDPILVHRRGEIIFINQATLDLLGISSPDEIIGRNIWEFNSTGKQVEIARKRAKLMESGEKVPWQEFDLIRPDGEKVAIEATGRSGPFPNGMAILTVWRDLSQRRQVEEEKNSLASQLRQAQKMEAVGTLAGGIAHDFNNILAAIMGYSELALDNAKKDVLNPKHIKEIMNAGNRAKELVSQILTFSRKLEPELKYINLNKVVDQTDKMLKRVIPKMIQIEHHLADDLQLVNADPTQLSQIIINLVSNAKDAMTDGGRLTIETENVTLDEEYSKQHVGTASGKYVRLTISDTGHGMDKETLKQIFDPFFTRKEVGKGTGLGLSTVYGIVMAHGGFINCYSEEGQGTTFRIYLPAIQPTDETEIPKDLVDLDALHGTETILLVDDEIAIRDMGQQILTSMGYQVLLAETGEIALDIYKDRGSDIDLIVLDISMPGMGGHKCLQEILQINPHARVVISSGYSRKGQLKDVLAASIEGYVPKPYSRGDMLKTVRNVLDR